MKHRPKYIIIGINNISCYQLIEYLKENYNEILIYSDYLSLLKKPKYYDNKDINNKNNNYYYNIALDQFKFTYNPLEFFIENYNFKYEKNLILNLKLDNMQEQINDIPLLNYCLETQIRRVANLVKIKFPKDKNSYDNYYSFVNGLGPITGKLIEDNKNIKSVVDIKTSLIKNNIYKNVEAFVNDVNNMEIDNENDNINHNFIYHLTEEDKFNKMINAYYPLKINSIHNVYVKKVNTNEKIIECILFFNDNMLQCKLPFNNVSDYIVDKNIYFKKYRILLCKIMDIKIIENEYSIIISHKIEDLEYFNKFSCVEEESYLNKSVTGFNINQDEDYKLSEIEKLKTIINIYKTNKNNQKLQKIKEEGYFKNIILKDIKKEYVVPDEYGRFYFRPSFLGKDHLTLTFSVCENITINYDIIIIDKNNKYIINNNEYKSTDEIITNFSNKLLKKIYEFKSNKYFKPPTKIKSILNTIFNNSYKKNIIIDDIIIGFLEDSPNYGTLFTRTNNDNYIIDYIEIAFNGFYFHNKYFENLSLLFDYYNENKDEDFYKEYICNQIIYNIHSQIEEIDMCYNNFEEEKDKNNLNWNGNAQDEDDDDGYDNKNILLGKKLKKEEFQGWNNNNNNKNNKNDNGWGENNSFGGWESKNNNNNNQLENWNNKNNFNTWENKDNNKNKSNDVEKKNNDNWDSNNKFDNWENNNKKDKKDNKFDSLENNNKNDKKDNNFDSWGNNNNNSKNNNEFNSWGNYNNNSMKNKNDNNELNSWGNNKKDNNELNSWENKNNNELNSWGNNSKVNNDKMNNDNEISIISSEKIPNNFAKINKEEDNWNNSNHFEYNNKNNNNNSYNNNNKYNNRSSEYNKNNFKNNNKQIWSKNKKNKNSNNNIASTFTGWDSEEEIIEENKDEINESTNNNNIWGSGNENNANNNNDIGNEWSTVPKNMDNLWAETKDIQSQTNNSNNNYNQNFFKKNNNQKSFNNRNNNQNNNLFNNKNNNGFKNNNKFNYQNGNNNNYNNNKFQKNNKGAWKDELDKVYENDEVREEEGEAIDFEKINMFGGYSMDKSNNKNIQNSEDYNKNKGGKKKDKVINDDEW